jgi:glycerol kinase
VLPTVSQVRGFRLVDPRPINAALGEGLANLRREPIGPLGELRGTCRNALGVHESVSATDCESTQDIHHINVRQLCESTDVSVLAIDQGTSGTKAIVVDEAGTVLALAEEPVRPQYLADGAVEQSPIELLESVLTAGRRAIDEAGVPIEVISLANQGETVLAWDRATGEPLTTALVWQDSRAQSVCDRLRGHSDVIAARSGLVLDPYFSAPKMAWIRENFTREGVVTTSDTWLLHRLTGEFVTDVSTASRSLIMNLDARAWDDELLGYFGLEGEALPRIAACDEVIGQTNAFGGSIPVGGVIVDQQAALLAEGCLEVGEAKCTYGTGAFLLMNTGTSAPRSTNGLTTSVAWTIRGESKYCIDGQVFTAASAIRWLQELGLISDARDIDTAAAADSGNVSFVPALAGLAAPWWRADAKAAFSGMSLATDRGQLIRAVLEGIAAQIADLAAACAADLGDSLKSLRVDGGLTRSAVLMQAQADILQLPIEVYPSAHATALGAAALGRLAVRPQEAVPALEWVPEHVYEPRWNADRAADFMGNWRAAVMRTLSMEGER